MKDYKKNSFEATIFILWTIFISIVLFLGFFFNTHILPTDPSWEIPTRIGN